jgi:hypothetical protein
MSVALDHLGIISAVELGDWTSVANRVASLAATAADLGDRDEAERRYGLAIRLAAPWRRPTSSASGSTAWPSCWPRPAAPPRPRSATPRP